MLDYDQATDRYRDAVQVLQHLFVSTRHQDQEEEEDLRVRASDALVHIQQRIAANGTEQELKSELESNITRSTDAIKEYSQLLSALSSSHSKTAGDIEQIAKQFTDAHGRGWYSVLPAGLKKRKAADNTSSNLRLKLVSL
jgi:hypothetical protein